MPLLGRSDAGCICNARAEAAKARADRMSAERQIRSSLRTQVRALEAAAVQVELAMANLNLAEETLAAEQALREAGRVIQKDLLESIATVDDARTQLEQAKGAYQLALIELERLKAHSENHGNKLHTDRVVSMTRRHRSMKSTTALTALFAFGLGATAAHATNLLDGVAPQPSSDSRPALAPAPPNARRCLQPHPVSRPTGRCAAVRRGQHPR